MARSLTITPEEVPTTSPLLTGFLVLAALVLLASSFSTASEAATGGVQIEQAAR